MGMGFILWYVCHFPGTRLCDLRASGGVKLFTGSCLAEVDGSNLLSIYPSKRQWWGFSKFREFYSKKYSQDDALCSFLY